MDLNLSVRSVEIKTGSYKEINLDITDADRNEVLSHFSIEDVVRYFGTAEVLAHIGEDEARNYFGIDQ